MEKQQQYQLHPQSQSQSEEEHPVHTAHQFINDPQQFLAFCAKDKKIKIMDECNPILPNVYLKDISLHKKGPLEDKMYSKHDVYYWNIRRGNTLCQIYDQQNQAQLFMCRRGMIKFYDLEPEYLKVTRKLTHQHQRYRNRIFEQLDPIFEENLGTKVHLYALFKENGEHCQVTYIRQLGYWLFASKNVSILAKDENDLATHYQKERFYWAKLIGQEFFRILANFPEEKKHQFMQDIEGKTLLGEHCGYEEHQHITKYDKIQIIFYGLVENEGTQHCLPVSQCQAFLDKYGLQMSKMEKVEGLTEKNKVYFNMFKLLKKVAEGTMDQCGEGSVLYIVAEDMQGNQRTVGMCKLKTCEYLIYRRMREMIKIYFAKKGMTANTFEKYKFEIENLVEHYFKPPKPLDHYFQIAELAFEEVRKNQKEFTDDEFRYKFVNFLDAVENKAKLRENKDKEEQETQPRRVILVCPPLLAEQTERIEKLSKKLGFSIQYNYRQIPNKKLLKPILHILHIAPRLNMEELQEPTTIVCYETNNEHSQRVIAQLTQSPDIRKSHLIGIIKSEDKNRAVELINEKIAAFAHSCSAKMQQFKTSTLEFRRTNHIQGILDAIQNRKVNKQKVEQMEEGEAQKNTAIITVVMTFLIPGSGKSTLAETLQAQYENRNIEVISSDKIRQAIMEKYKGKRKDDEIENSQAYAATKKKGLEKYRQAVKQALGEQPPEENMILFIDRVFCPTTIMGDIEEIKRPWTKFIIITQIQTPTRLNEYIYPHSLSYLLGCIMRSIEREEHETLSAKPYEIVKVILKFYQLFRGFTYNRLARQLEELNVDVQFLQLDFLSESQEEDNLFLKKKVEECLKGVSPGHDAPDSPLYIELIELIYKYRGHIEKPAGQGEKQKKMRNFAEKLLAMC